MNLRSATIAVGALDTAAWLVVALALALSGSDAATKGLDRAAAGGITALYAATGAPALVLAAAQRAPRTALFLALAFPAAFALALVAVVFALP